MLLTKSTLFFNLMRPPHVCGKTLRFVAGYSIHRFATVHSVEGQHIEKNIRISISRELRPTFGMKFSEFGSREQDQPVRATIFCSWRKGRRGRGRPLDRIECFVWLRTAPTKHASEP